MPYNPRISVVLRGSDDEILVAERLVEELDTPKDTNIGK
jgi:hypothetical protein